jgi:hypothetical protein
MAFNTHNIYHPLIVNSGWTSQSVSATTISANTFYGGSLSATYVGNQNVTNQEFIYLSGTTGYVQTQINNLVNKTEPLLTFQNSDVLSNERIFTATTNLNFSVNNNVDISLNYPSIDFSSITVSLLSTQTAITNFNPSQWQENDNIRSTHIFFNSYVNSIISGLVGGTDGRIAIITNNTVSLIILEHLSSKCLINNQFKFANEKPIFLTSNRSITLIYNKSINKWVEMYPQSNEMYYDVYEEFLNPPSGIVGGNREYFNQSQIPYYSFTGIPNPTGALGQIFSTGYTGTDGVAVFKPKTSNASTPSHTVMTASRAGASNSVSNLSVFKVKFNIDFDYSAFTQSSTFIYVGSAGVNNTTTSQTYLRSALCWRTPYSSSTVVYDKNKLIYGIPGSFFLESPLFISALTENFYILGTYWPLAPQGNPRSPGAFFYSSNGNDFNWGLTDTIPSSWNPSQNFLSSVQVTTTNINASPELHIDWLGVIKK